MFANFVENIGKVGLINMDSMDNNNENRINYCDNPKQGLYYQLKQLTFDTKCCSYEIFYQMNLNYPCT